MVVKKEPVKVAAQPKDTYAVKVAQLEKRIETLESKMESVARIFEDLNLILTDEEYNDLLSINEEEK